MRDSEKIEIKNTRPMSKAIQDVQFGDKDLAAPSFTQRFVGRLARWDSESFPSKLIRPIA
jgi:hypothetical protein